MVSALTLLVAGAGVGGLLWLSFVQVFLVQWNAPRLAPAAALVRGLAIYGTADSGPFLGWFYGPVFPLVFAAIAWLPDQVSVHAAAWGLNLLLAAGPVWMAARCVANRAAAGGALLLGGLAVLGTSLGRGVFSFIHVDVLCVALGVTACVALVRGLGAGGRGWLVIAAVASVLAVGTKQVAVGLVIGLAGWLWAARRWRELGVYLGGLAGMGVVAVTAAVPVFGWRELVFNLWTVHLHNPLAPDWAAQLSARFGLLLLEALPVLLVWLVARPVAASDPVADRLERALVWVALAQLPFGLLAAVKVAGGLNSVHTFHYLACLLVMRLARVLAAPVGPGWRGWIMLAAAAVLAVGQGGQAARREQLPLRPEVQRLRDEDTLARREAGRVYFPWNPLVTVLTERRVRPFDDALLCLERVGFPAEPAAVRAEIPSGALVVYPEPVQSMYALRYLQRPPP